MYLLPSTDKLHLDWDQPALEPITDSAPTREHVVRTSSEVYPPRNPAEVSVGNLEDLHELNSVLSPRLMIDSEYGVAGIVP